MYITQNKVVEYHRTFYSP